MSADEWRRRCAERFMVMGGLPEKQAIEQAMECWLLLDDAGENPLDTSPEFAADEEMSYWENDGDEP